ncbi:MAG: GTPase Era [Parvibaculaceae bacterium]
MSATRAGFVAILGVPNAGKSTLVNQLVGSKISIVTPKVQTTRSRVRGIVIAGETQLVLVDTPGIFAAKRKLERAMVEAAWSAASDADAVVLVADARHGLDEGTEAIISGLERAGAEPALALNKVDLMQRDRLLPVARAFSDRMSFLRTFMVSAATGDGVEDLKSWLAARMPEGPWLYPEDQVADLPLRQLASEITREQLFLKLHEELPYSLTVETELWQERKDGSVRIEQVIFVERESQRKIILGRQGQQIKAIGQAARIGIAEAIGQPVHLFLFVKVREKWTEDSERLRMMGLEPPRK